MTTWPNKSLQATRDGRSSSASRFTLFGPACLSSGRQVTMKLLILAAATLVVAGCASTAPQSAAAAPPISPIDGSSIVVKQDLRFLPSLSGYLIPAGTHLPVCRAAHRGYYQSRQ